MGVKISKLIQETAFYNDPDSDLYNIEVVRLIYGAIPGDDKHRAIRQFLRGNPEI